MSALDEIVNMSQGITAYKARVELSALRAAKEQTEKVIALNKYITPPFDLTDDATVQLALKCVELERERDEARARVAALEAATDKAAEQIENGDIRTAHDVLHTANIGSTLTPRRCGQCCTEAAKAMREACIAVATEQEEWAHNKYISASDDDEKSRRQIQQDMAATISFQLENLPLPPCDCNPLKPEDAPHTCQCPCGCTNNATTEVDGNPSCAACALS